MHARPGIDKKKALRKFFVFMGAVLATFIAVIVVFTVMREDLRRFTSQ